ncbi:hypothetical protein [Rossellomorea aquimaris]|uniref:hypothetical protein n=1 Tax=Rossellomorea aquimaris TaxID=189382 RepID=UPI0005C90667|nr:hypothetical protein [Rossellomorea aquimaris]
MGKIKEIPEKVAFTIGLSLLLVSPLMFLVLSIGSLTMILQAIVIGIATLFILSAADQRHPRLRKDK